MEPVRGQRRNVTAGVAQLCLAPSVRVHTLVPVLPEYGLRPVQASHAVHPARPWLAFNTATFICFLQGRLLG